MTHTSKIYNPHTNIWINANAGSGKTTALKNRYLSLLLSGVSHQNIWCITYTKAAAKEMKERIFLTLEKWSEASDEE